ncbi:MAG: hypothetical protein AMJ54_00235 [Deltaproteobacteria bacterium SG8_13]|nr:MAG: hypothetical protein AMJ54_00235 [Deltaproteobacteria bacterium SG8_13]
MVVKCPTCQSGYQIDESKIPARGAYTRCRKCQTRFKVQVGSTVPPPAEAGKDAPAPLPESSAPLNPEAAAPQNPEAAGQAVSADEDRRIQEVVASGDQEAIARLLLDLIIEHAGRRNFARAETLRDQLYEAAPLALNEIVKANETIDEEKSGSIDSEHLELWSGLFESLESDEASELYYAMQTANTHAGQPVFEKGQYNSNLYFVQSGSLKMLHFDPGEKKEIVLKQMRAGSLFNMEAFFSFTVTTCAVVAEADCTLRYLEQSILDRWREKFPRIEPKLNSFCRQFEDVRALVKKTGADVRSSPRYLVSMAAIIQFLDTYGKPSKKPFKVTLFDISSGGISFGLKLNRRQEAAQLLGQALFMQTGYVLDGKKQKVSQKGRIIAAHLQPFGESSVHVQFDKSLPDDAMADIMKVSGHPPEDA